MQRVRHDWVTLTLTFHRIKCGLLLLGNFLPGKNEVQMGKLRENNYKGEVGQWNRCIYVSTIGKPVWNRTHNTQKRLKDWITSVLKVYNTKTPWKKLKDIQNLEEKCL